jgi:hypothetical protein
VSRKIKVFAKRTPTIRERQKRKNLSLTLLQRHHSVEMSKRVRSIPDRNQHTNKTASNKRNRFNRVQHQHPAVRCLPLRDL